LQERPGFHAAGIRPVDQPGPGWRQQAAGRRDDDQAGRTGRAPIRASDAVEERLVRGQRRYDDVVRAGDALDEPGSAASPFTNVAPSVTGPLGAGHPGDLVAAPERFPRDPGADIPVTP